MKSLSSAFLVAVLMSLAANRLLAADAMTITVDNAAGLARPAETIDVPWHEITSRLPDALPDHLVVKDAAGRPLPAQYTNFHPDDRKGVYDDFLFQHDFAAGEQRAVFTVETTPAPVPPFSTQAFARYIPERLDDFAWENDRIAHRVYGPALETSAAGSFQLIGSGIDVWSKRVRYPIVDRWYLRGHDHYHKDTGEGLDMYEMGRSRGCGGTGVGDGARLFVSRNWKTWKVLANGPVRAVFELAYAPWDAGGVTVAETKRFTVDAGHNFDQIESTFVFAGRPQITVAVGLNKHPAEASALTENYRRGWLSLWEEAAEGGQLGSGVLLAPGLEGSFAEENTDYLLLTTAAPGKPLRYYAGAGWDRSGDFASQTDWNAYIAALKARLEAPVTLSYSPPPVHAP